MLLRALRYPALNPSQQNGIIIIIIDTETQTIQVVEHDYWPLGLLLNRWLYLWT